MRFVYHSFEGRFSDSPRAIYEALAARRGADAHLWLADPDHEGDFPAGVPTARYGAPESVEALEAADVLVANTHTDLDWAKPRGCLYLQTWHGTPLKRIHWDVLWAPPGRLERLSRDVERWDCLLSQNRASTPRLRHAFRYTGELLETGYPRNDLLSRPDREAIRARVRAELGIPDGATAVLYTPTWRDDLVFAEGGERLALHLDVADFAERLGADHVLLARLHYLQRRRLPELGHPAVRDVSAHPDVAELYLAADVLVTDYSSTMFDFAITGKPMLFLVPDLDDYGRRLRGFYFDFAPEAPGPLLETTDELVDALRDLPAVVQRHERRYARFRATFCALEDGHATERVVARILAHRPRARG